MGAIYGGLSSERYDRTYRDQELVRRIARRFRPEWRRLSLVAAGTLLDAILQASMPLLIRRGIDAAAAAPATRSILILCLAILAAGALAWTCNALRQVASARVTGDVILRLRLDLFRAVVGHDMSFFDENPSAGIVSRITGDTSDLAEVVSLTTNLASQVLLVVPLLVILFRVHWRLALLVLVVAPSVMWASVALRRISRPVAVRERRMRATINANVSESIGGIAVAKAFRQERTLYDAFRQLNRQAYRVGLMRGLVIENMFTAVAGLRALAISLILYAGGVRVLQGQISPGTWYLFIQAFELFLGPFMMIASFWSQFQNGLSAAERVFALLDVEPRVIQQASEPAGSRPGREHPVDRHRRERPVVSAPSNGLVERLRGQIDFQHTSFAYRPGQDVLRDFTLTVRPGETLAFVGHTGAGKSSLARLIARFYEFQEGAIRIDGRDIRTFDLTAYRRQIGLVPQVPFLFAGTLLDNIRYGAPEASEEDALAAARRVAGGDWLDNLPHGLQTEVGERGANLSLGQRQLVALARVLLHDPAILVLDEATASVDPYTEARIQEGLEQVFRNRTSIVIAHRLSTVRRADRIVVLEHGEIIQEGSHDALLAAGGPYAELYNRYFRHQEPDYRAVADGA